MQFSSDGRFLCVAAGHSLYIYRFFNDPPGKFDQAEIKEKPVYVNTVNLSSAETDKPVGFSLSQTEGWYAVYSADEIRLGQLSDDSCKKPVPLPLDDRVKKIDFTPDGKFLVLTTENNKRRYCTVQTLSDTGTVWDDFDDDCHISMSSSEQILNTCSIGSDKSILEETGVKTTDSKRGNFPEYEVVRTDWQIIHYNEHDEIFKPLPQALKVDCNVTRTVLFKVGINPELDSVQDLQLSSTSDVKNSHLTSTPTTQSFEQSFPYSYVALIEDGRGDDLSCRLTRLSNLDNEVVKQGRAPYGFSPNGKLFALAGEGLLSIFQLESPAFWQEQEGEELEEGDKGIFTFPPLQSSKFKCLTFAHKHNMVAVGYDNKRVEFVTIGGTDRTALDDLPGSVTCIDFRLDDQYLAVIAEAPRLPVMSPEKEKSPRSYLKLYRVSWDE